MSQATHRLNPLKRPDSVAKGAIVLRVCPQTQQQTLFALHKLQQLRGTSTLYLLPSASNDQRYDLAECQAASWADFSMLKSLQVGSETWYMSHPHQQLTEHTDGETCWLSVCDVYLAALALSDYFDGTVLLPHKESLADPTEQLSVQWAETETT